jgi:hypothetical protein
VLPFLPRGKGIWIRRISACENGELDTIVAKAEAARYTHVFLKIADGSDAYNLDPLTHRDRAVDLTVKLHAVGLDVWGWHNIYGDKPLFKGSPMQANYHVQEADCAVQRVKRLQAAGLRGYVIAPEGEYKRILDRAEKAAEFMEIVRQGLDNFPIGLTAWKQPSAHRSFPWETFRSRCDLDLPQVFWIGRHGEAARQLETSFKQFSQLQPRLPYIPVGPAFFEDNWRPSPEEIMAFLEKALALGVPAVTLWNWDHLGLTGDETTDNPERLDFREHWQAAADFAWREIKIATEDGRPRTVDEGRRTKDKEVAPEPTPEPEFTMEDGRRWTDEVPAPEPTPEDLTLEHLTLVEPEAEDELPEWLQFLNTPETETPFEPEPAEAELDFTVEVEDEDDLPEWLQFLNESQPPTETTAPSLAETELASPADQETEEELPDWLQFTGQPKPELPFEASHSELTPEPEPLLPEEPISEASKLEETEPPQPELAPIPAEPPLEPALTVTTEALPEVSQPEEAEPPQPDLTPAPAEPPLEPALTVTAEALPEVSQPEEAEPPQPELTPAPAEPALEPALAVTAEALPEVSQSEEAELPQPDLTPAPAEPPFEPALAVTAEALPEFSQPEEAEIPQPDLTPTPAESPFEPAFAVTAEALPEVSQPEEAEPPQPDLTPAPAESTFEPAFAVTVEGLPEVSQPEEAELPQPDLTPTPSESPFESAFAVTAEALPEVSQPEEVEPSQTTSVPVPAATKEPKPIFFTAPAPPASTGGARLPKRAIARVASTGSPIPRDDTVSQFFDALRNGEPELAVTFYGPGFVHVNRDRVEHDPTTLAEFYTELLGQIEGPELAWSTIPLSRAIVNVKWNTLTLAGKPVHGTDTFHLNPAGQIVYHHTSFRIENGVTP